MEILEIRVSTMEMKRLEPTPSDERILLPCESTLTRVSPEARRHSDTVTQ